VGSCARREIGDRDGFRNRPESARAREWRDAYDRVMSASPPAVAPLARNRFLQVLLTVYGAVWIVLAIAPSYRSDWLLENLLVFAFAAALAATHRRFVFSNLSWLLIALFLALHAVGAHSTYSETPIGFWLQDVFGWSRNHYDRVVHFAFGALLTYPMREIALRSLRPRPLWGWLLPFLAALSASCAYELIEAWVAWTVSPELGTAYLGTQGDEWDAQRDMTCAFSGAVFALLATAVYRRATGHEPWVLFAPHRGGRRRRRSA
jgi:putative membrane protein